MCKEWWYTTLVWYEGEICYVAEVIRTTLLAQLQDVSPDYKLAIYSEREDRIKIVEVGDVIIC